MAHLPAAKKRGCKDREYRGHPLGPDLCLSQLSPELVLEGGEWGHAAAPPIEEAEKAALLTPEKGQERPLTFQAECQWQKPGGCGMPSLHQTPEPATGPKQAPRERSEDTIP